MTNQQIAELAKDKGYKAELSGSAIFISLDNRRVSMMEIENELDIPREVMAIGFGGILVYGLI